MAGRGGWPASLRGDAGVSESRQEIVVPCAGVEGSEVVGGWRGGLGCASAQVVPRRAIECAR